MEKIAALGVSRGLGAEFIKIAGSRAEGPWLLSSRKGDLLSDLVERLGINAEIVSSDFSNSADQEKLLQAIHDFGPTRIIYFAGGGPHSSYQKTEWKNHLWAWEVSFLFAARILHKGLRDLAGLRQITFIGSAIAEDSADPGGASYAAAKHALKGLVKSVREERPSLDVRLYSPGYMDTSLLPPNAWPRQQGLVLDPRTVAQDLVTWIFQNDEVGFRIFKG